MTNLDVTDSTGAARLRGRRRAGTAAGHDRRRVRQADRELHDQRLGRQRLLLRGLRRRRRRWCAIRAAGSSIGGTLDLPEGPLAARGSLTERGVVYQYTSFTGRVLPVRGSVRIYLLKPLSAVEKLCGGSDADTQVATSERVARLIYEGEGGSRTLVQVHRVQRNAALLAAVARRDPAATRTAVAALLHHHIVRLRVSAGGLVLRCGGPYVLAPVHAEAAPPRTQDRELRALDPGR